MTPPRYRTQQPSSGAGGNDAGNHARAVPTDFTANAIPAPVGAVYLATACFAGHMISLSLPKDAAQSAAHWA